MSHFPIILSAPSGGGKTTIAREILKRRQDVGYSVSCTTRAPRPGEVDGRDYYFTSVEEFVRRRDEGEFAEYAEVHGRMYGTLRSEVQRILDGGQHVLMDIDVQGAASFAASFPDSVLIFLIPPSAQVLRARLAGRMTEDPVALERRLRGACEELRSVGSYQYVIVNDELEVAIRQTSEIIDVEALRRHRQPDLSGRVNELIDMIEDLLAGS